MRFDISAEVRLGDRTIGASFVGGEGLTALFGPSGSGKTTMLNMVAGLIRPDSGRIVIGGETLFDADARIDVPPHRRRAGYIFQDSRLFPHMRVRQNLLYGWKRAEPAHRWITMDEVASFLDIGHLLDRWPRTLSGGEERRVAIGRALLSGARFMLMDEPLTSLDQPRREEIMIVIERLREQLKMPILYVTHDKGEVDRLATAIIPIGCG